MMGNKDNGKGVASLVLGIISIVFCWVPLLALVGGIVGIVLSVKQRKEYSNGIATAGLVTSIIGTVFSAFYMLIWIFIGTAIGGAIAFL